MNEPTSVRVVLADHGGRLLLLQRAADDETYPGLWEFPGGGIDAGETASQAAARELSEEVGVSVPAGSLADWGVYERRDETGQVRRTAFFAVECAAEDCAPALSHEHDAWTWLGGADGLPPLTPSAAWAVDRRR